MQTDQNHKSITIITITEDGWDRNERNIHILQQHKRRREKKEQVKHSHLFETVWYYSTAIKTMDTQATNLKPFDCMHILHVNSEINGVKPINT